MKLRIETETGICFYYPDSLITRHRARGDAMWQSNPAAVFEILSDDTRRTDEVEKMYFYRQIPEMEDYVLIEQNSPSVVVDRRTGDNWKPERYTGLDSVVPLPALGTQLPLADLYERLAL